MKKDPLKTEIEQKMKRRLVMLALEAAPSYRPAMVFVDTRFPDIEGVPLEHLNHENKVFGLSHRLPQFIEVNGFGVKATLDFGGQSRRCFFPWDSIHGLVVNESEWGFVRIQPPRRQ